MTTSVGMSVTAIAGPPRTSASLVAAAFVPIGYAIQTSNQGQVSVATSDVPLAGLAVSSSASGQNVNVQVMGPVDRTIVNLGAGTTGLVGITATGKPVRSTDPSCITKSNFLGYTDADGTVTIGGFAAGGGAQGTSAIASTSSGTSLVAIRTGNSGQVAPADSVPSPYYPSVNLTRDPFSGLSLAALVTGVQVPIQTAGPVPRATFNLGTGTSCAVGVNTLGVPVRVTDPTCTSAGNMLGTCDTDGTVTINPKRVNVFDVRDFGAKGDGVTDDTAAFQAVLSAVQNYLIHPLDGVLVPPYAGFKMYIPQGVYVITQTLIIPPYLNIEGDGARTSILLCTIPASPMARPWGHAMLLDFGSPSNVTTNQAFKKFGIINNQRGTVLQRAAFGGAGIAILGTSGITLENLFLMGHKRALLLDGASVVEGSDLGLFAAGSAPSNIGYPGPADGYSDSVGCWIAYGGQNVVVTSVATAPGTLINGDSITLAFDFGSSKTVTFTGPQTLTQVVSDINAAFSPNVYASQSGGQLVLTSIFCGMDNGFVDVISGSAVAKLGLTVGLTAAVGNGQGMQNIGSDVANLITIKHSALGGEIGIWEQDGVAHTFQNIVSEGGWVAWISGNVIASNWSNISQEGQDGTELFKVFGGAVTGLSIRDSIFQGWHSHGPGASLINVSGDGSYIFGLTIDNVVYGATGDGRAVINFPTGNCIRGSANVSGIRTNDNSPIFPTDPNIRPSAAVRYSDGGGYKQGRHGFNTGNPDALIDVDQTATDATYLYRIMQSQVLRWCSALSDGSVWEYGKGTAYTAGNVTQQGVREFFNRGPVITSGWNSSTPGKIPTVVIDYDAEAIATLEVHVVMRDSDTGSPAKTWVLKRSAHCTGGVVSVDSNTSFDEIRSFGSLPGGGSWVDPSLDCSTNKITVNIQPGTTGSGTYMVYAKIVNRSNY